MSSFSPNICQAGS